MRKIYVRDNKLKKIRKEMGHTQKKFAEDILEENYTWYNPIENGKNSISKKKAESICNKLNKDFKEVFEYKTEFSTDEQGKSSHIAISEDKKEDWNSIFSKLSESEMLQELKSFKELKQILDKDSLEVSQYGSFSLVTGWEKVVGKGLCMLQRANKYWWGAGVLGSWINREEVGKDFGNKLTTAMENDVDVRILINNTAEMILEEKTSGEFGRLKNSTIEGQKESLISTRLKELLFNYQDKGSTDLGGAVRWFSHGDIRVFIADSLKDTGGENQNSELMIVTADPSLDGGGEPRHYTALITHNPFLIREHKKRFKVLWEHSAVPEYWELAKDEDAED